VSADVDRLLLVRVVISRASCFDQKFGDARAGPGAERGRTRWLDCLRFDGQTL
jgi:hypothetical protein